MYGLEILEVIRRGNKITNYLNKQLDGRGEVFPAVLICNISIQSTNWALFLVYTFTNEAQERVS